MPVKAVPNRAVPDLGPPLLFWRVWDQIDTQITVILIPDGGHFPVLDHFPSTHIPHITVNTLPQNDPFGSTDGAHGLHFAKNDYLSLGF